MGQVFNLPALKLIVHLNAAQMIVDDAERQAD